MLQSVKTGDLLMINVGTCPHCESVVPFQETHKEHIFKCPDCGEKARQYINGKVLYNKIVWDLEKDERKD